MTGTIWAEPREHYEVVDGKPVEKNDMTAKHSKTQAKLSYYWWLFNDQHRLGGSVYTQPPCCTINERRRLPDVAYATAEFVAEYAEPSIFPKSFPLVAEIVSPNDIGEEIFLKVQEYLSAGTEEVWLVFPQSELVFVSVSQSYYCYSKNQVAISHKVLPNFSIAVAELLA